MNNTTAVNLHAQGAQEDGNFTYDTLLSMYEQKAPIAVAVDRMVTPFFYLLGIPCNPLCAFIWLGRRTRRNNSSAIYLGALSISHTALLLLHILMELNYAWGIPTYDGYVTCELFYLLYYWPQYLAPLLVLGFTVERYLAICRPFLKERYCTVRRAILVATGMTLGCLLLSSVQAYLWTYDENYLTCNHRPSLRETSFPSLWTWFTELVIFGVAPLAALLFNILVIREIRTINTRGPASVHSQAGAGPGSGQNQASTSTLLYVSFYLICTWLPATLVYSLEREFPMRSPNYYTYYTVRKIAEEVTISNSACYFFIYYLTGRHFRDSVKQLLCPEGSCPANGSCLAEGSCLAKTKNNSRKQEPKNYIAISNTDNGHTCVTTV